jgi:DNA mismatch endonuclease (patch repair protein)
MQATRSRDTAPEMALRRELHRRGLRYRVDMPVLPGLRRRADVVFTRQRLAVFVDGCFWHGCPQHGTVSRSNAVFWRDKIKTNVARDADTNQRLAQAGWTVMRVWAHESAQAAADQIARMLGSAASSLEGTREPDETSK